MGIDISRLSQSAQKQIMQKLAAQNREKAEKLAQEQAEQKRKYHNTPTERTTEDGKTIKFDSQKEARRFDELMVLYRAGQIHDLKLQPQFTLQESYVTPEGKRIRAIRYVADFSYNTGLGKVVEDIKGGKATKTNVYELKKKLFREKYGMDICEVD